MDFKFDNENVGLPHISYIDQYQFSQFLLVYVPKFWVSYTTTKQIPMKVSVMCWSLFLIKLQAFQAATFLKTDSNTGVMFFFVRLQDCVKSWNTCQYVVFSILKWKNCKWQQIHTRTSEPDCFQFLRKLKLMENF